MDFVPAALGHLCGYRQNNLSNIRNRGFCISKSAFYNQSAEDTERKYTID